MLNARWLNPKDPRTSLASSLLPDLSGGGVMVLRRRLGDRWDGDPVLAFVDSLGHPRAVMKGEKRIGRSFVAALRTAAEASSIRDVGSEFTGQLVEPSLVVRFANEQQFRDAAVGALRNATFRPAMRDGRTVSQCVKQFFYWCAP